MSIVTEAYLRKQLELMGRRTIKHLIGRQRLRFSMEALAFYLMCIARHQSRHVHLKRIYEEAGLSITYSAFIHDIQAVAPLAKALFFRINKAEGVKPSRLVNMIDSSLLEEKREASIRQRDWNAGRVTTRTLHGVKTHICGSKLLCFINRFGKIYHAQRTNINNSDHNVLKDSAFYADKLRGFILADRGFNNAIVRDRLRPMANVRLLSPPHHATKAKLTDREAKLYRRRWSIETMFQKLKDTYGDFKLNLKSRMTDKLNEAKLFVTLTAYNLSF